MARKRGEVDDDPEQQTLRLQIWAGNFREWKIGWEKFRRESQKSEFGRETLGMKNQAGKACRAGNILASP